MCFFKLSSLFQLLYPSGEHVGTFNSKRIKVHACILKIYLLYVTLIVVWQILVGQAKKIIWPIPVKKFTLAGLILVSPGPPQMLSLRFPVARYVQVSALALY